MVKIHKLFDALHLRNFSSLNFSLFPNLKKLLTGKTTNAYFADLNENAYKVGVQAVKN